MLDIQIIRSYTNYDDQEGIIMNQINPASSKPLSGKTVLITGSARRIGRSLALTVCTRWWKCRYPSWSFT